MTQIEERLLLNRYKRFQLEADLTELVQDWLGLQSDLYHKKISDSFQKGISDILICVRGFFVAAELKADDGTPSRHQIKFIDNIRKAGGIGDVCYTLDDVISLVEQARKRDEAVIVCAKI